MTCLMQKYKVRDTREERETDAKAKQLRRLSFLINIRQRLKALRVVRVPRAGTIGNSSKKQIKDIKMRTFDLLQKVESVKVRGAWNNGVKEYAIELLDDAASNRECEEFASLQELKDAILNGASDWKQYSEGGCSLIYNADIAERLCSPSELKRTKNGLNDPNSRENWVQVQARALFQAWELIKRVYNEMNK